MILTIETMYHIPNCPSIALLTDFHNSDPTPIIASLEQHSPELICIAGDIIVGKRPEGDVSPLNTQEHVLPFLQACASIAPTFLSLGNHEWMLDENDLSALSSTSVTVLDNSFSTAAVNGENIVIGGLTSGFVTDYRHFRKECANVDRYPQREDMHGIGGFVSEHKPEIDWLDGYCSTPGYHILLCHHPEYWPLISRHPIDLVLSGHAHGGQWRIYNPLKKEWIGIYAPGQGWLPKWSRGVYQDRLVVSAGLSNTTRIPRIWNPTEIVYLDSL